MSDETELLSLHAGRADETSLVAKIADLVNGVYEVAEKGLWTDTAARTSRDEIATLIRAGQITVIRAGDRIVGCVRIQGLDESTSEFGMLTASFDHRGTGLGRRLVQFAEQDSVNCGRHTMQLELLVPRTWIHPSKELLAGWYERIGYEVVRTGTIDEAYPELAPLLATPCDFVIYQKDLTALALEA